MNRRIYISRHITVDLIKQFSLFLPLLCDFILLFANIIMVFGNPVGRFLFVISLICDIGDHARDQADAHHAGTHQNISHPALPHNAPQHHNHQDGQQRRQQGQNQIPLLLWQLLRWIQDRNILHRNHVLDSRAPVKPRIFQHGFAFGNTPRRQIVKLQFFFK